MDTEEWRSAGRARFGSILRNTVSFPGDAIDIDPETGRRANIYASENNQISYRDHNILDEVYHWFHAYTRLPGLSPENIIPRLKHPIIVYSAITQLLVKRYKAAYGTEQTATLLTNSCVVWKDQKYPLRKWNAVYNQRGSNHIIWPPYSLTEQVDRYFTEGGTVARVRPAPAPPPPPFLLGHSAKATDSFSFKFGKAPAFKIPMGIELELENLTEKAQPILVELLGHHAIFKRDGSVSAGVEICTAPATLDIHKEVFKTFFENKQSGLKVEPNCGLHVHVERKTIKQTQLAKIMMFMNNASNNDFIERIAGRSANTYCRAETTSWAAMINTTSGDKYRRVNLAPEHTIEFRLFASTLDYGQFSRCLEFVQCVVDYTKSGEHDCSIKEMIEKEPFIKYLGKNRQYYPELFKFVNPTLVKANPTKGESLCVSQ